MYKPVLNIENKNRYLGPKTFTEENRSIFFGREKDTVKLSDFIIANRLSVLYGKSGLGKSSLLNAGVIPLLQAQQGYFPINIRFHNDSPNLVQHISPLENLATTLDNQIKIDFFSDFENPTLIFWKKLKNLELNAYPNKTLLFVLDQFEEFFTYSESEVVAFAQQFADLLNNRISNETQKVLYQYIENPLTTERIYNQMLSDTHFKMSEEFILQNEELNAEEFRQAAIQKIKELLLEPINLKVLFSIRSDRMSQINMIAAHIPNILRNCYELKQLNNEDSQRAIVKPAEIENSSFLSPTFQYEQAAIDKILTFFSAQNKEIEPFLLQIICLNIENKLVIQKGYRHILSGFISDNEAQNSDINTIHLHSITKDFYLDITQKAIDETNSNLSVDKLREVLENSLVYDGKRSLILSEELIEHCGKNTIFFLENEHLIRGEQHSSGSRFYELSHDTLVAPIQMEMEKRQQEKARLKEEEEKKHLIEREELMRFRAEQAETRLREEQAAIKIQQEQAEMKIKEDNVKRSKRLASVGIGLILFGIVMLFLWYYSLSSKEEKLDIAGKKLDIAEQKLIKKDRELLVKDRELAQIDSLLSSKQDSLNIAYGELENKHDEISLLLIKFRQDSLHSTKEIVRLQAIKQEVENKMEKVQQQLAVVEGEKDIAKKMLSQAKQDSIKAAKELAVSIVESQKLQRERDTLTKNAAAFDINVYNQYFVLKEFTQSNSISTAKMILRGYPEIVTDSQALFSSYVYLQYPSLFIRNNDEEEHFSTTSNDSSNKNEQTNLHNNGIYDINYSRDKQYMLVAKSDGTAHLKKAASKEVIVSIRHKEGVRKAIFSDDEAWIATASLDKSVQIINNNQQGKGIAFYKTLQADIPLLALDFSPDSKYIAAAGAGNRLYVWNITNAREKYIFTFDEIASIQKIEFISNNRILIEKFDKGTKKRTLAVMPFLNNKKDLVTFMKRFVR